MDTSPDSIRVVGEAELLRLARVARSTWKHWLDKGLAQEAQNGLYTEASVVEVVAIAEFVEALGLTDALIAWNAARKRVVAQGLALDLEHPGELDAIVDVHTLDVDLADDAASLYEALHTPHPFPRGQLILVLAQLVCEARRGFWKRAVSSATLAQDKRRTVRRAKGRRGSARGP